MDSKKALVKVTREVNGELQEVEEAMAVLYAIEDIAENAPLTWPYRPKEAKKDFSWLKAEIVSKYCMLTHGKQVIL